VYIQIMRVADVTARNEATAVSAVSEPLNSLRTATTTSGQIR
jgi:hypothetical protein